MVKSRDVAKRNYLNKIRELGGAKAYYDCGKLAETGPAIKVAECLQGLKKARSEEDWAKAWEKRMYG